MSSIPGAAASGLTGDVTLVDSGTGVTLATASVEESGLSPFFTNYPAIFLFAAKNCESDGDAMEVAVWHPGASDMNLALVPGLPGVSGPDGSGNLTFGGLDGSTIAVDTVVKEPYMGGASAIQSVGISTLPGFDPTKDYTQVARIQHLACGNADGTPVICLGSQLDSTWRFPDPPCDINEDLVCDQFDVHLALDMDVTNGSGPCDPIDAMANVPVGQTYAVAVCLVSAGAKPSQVHRGWPAGGLPIRPHLRQNAELLSASGSRIRSPSRFGRKP